MLYLILYLSIISLELIVACRIVVVERYNLELDY